MENSSLIIQLRGISFGYSGRNSFLQDVDFDFRRGERIGLIGPNGAGKSTLFHLIMGLLRPQAGTLKVFGQTRAAEADFRTVRSRIGLVFQDADDQLFSPTVAEDIAFGPLNLGRSHSECRDIVARTLERVGLSGFDNRITYKLSGGEKKLIALASVLAMEPEVLLLDEPFAGLDKNAAERIVTVLQQSKLSYLIISHELGYLKKTVQRCCELHSGKLHCNC
ncbi:MAG: ABC transporter ATP-binding protein [Deltaproteobacteria bacterium]|nr:ABC transporter ATP-binding protein [Deltaproteobacteria bacterium]